MVNSKRARKEKSWKQPRGKTYVKPKDLLSGLERVREAVRRGYSTRILINASALLPEVGAQCISSARWDLYGGCRVTGIPTVTLSNDAYNALVQYLKIRPSSRVKRVFLVEKGRYRGKPVDVRGIQHRMQHYTQEAGLKVTCHQLRHTMATQLLNADADLVTIQDLLGHTRIKTTQRYCRVSNLKVQRDYHKAMERVMHRHGL